MQSRCLLHQASRTECERDRRHLKAQAWQIAREARRRAAGACLRRQAKNGIFTKSKKLHKIVGIRREDANGVQHLITNVHDVVEEVRGEFRSRWQCGVMHRIEILRGVVDSHDRHEPQWTSKELMIAFASIGNQYRCDRRGFSVAMFNLFFQASPVAAQIWFGWLAGSTAAALQCRIAARGLGKSSSTPLAKDVRVVLPLEAHAQVLDALIAHRLQAYLSRQCMMNDLWWVGAVKYTQPMELMWMLSQMIEKSLDDRSRGALAQSDIRSFYDNNDLLLCTQWLLSRCGPALDRAVVVAALRWQLLPEVDVDINIGMFAAPSRTGGSVTGSRVAGALGRIPVEDSLRECAPLLARYAWQAGPRAFAVGVFVDNLFSVSQSLGGALRIQQGLAEVLRRKWRLSIKPSSRVAMPVAGAAELQDLDDFALQWPDWKFSASFRCLGGLLDSRGSALEDFDEVKKAVLTAVILNSGSHVKRALGDAQKRALLERVALSRLDYRSTRWPRSETLNKKQDALQRRCLSILFGSARLQGEDVDTWQRRRSREAGALAREHGTWSNRHAVRVTNWRHHVERADARGELIAHIWAWRDRAWRQRARMAAGSESRDAGRLGLRAVTHVCPRWEDSLP